MSYGLNVEMHKQVREVEHSCDNIVCGDSMRRGILFYKDAKRVHLSLQANYSSRGRREGERERELAGSELDGLE